MIMNIKYIASSGNEYELTTNGIFHRSASYFQWAWKPEGTKLQYGTRLSNFSKEPAQYEADLIFYGTSDAITQKIQALHKDFENDIRHMTPGRIVIEDHYLDCYIIQSDIEPLSCHWTWLSNPIEIYAPYPYWVQEMHITLPVSEIVSGSYLDYEFDYQYDYTAPAIGIRNIKSDAPFESEFKMIIFGQAVNPRITINGYSYVLYATIPTGAYAVIDSRTKTIVQYASDGTKTNLFDYRNKADSIFEKIPGGNLAITWDATFGVDITIYHELSEPRIEVPQ